MNCIESIQQQEAEFKKIIFVDYGSSIDVQSEVEEYLNSITNVQYVYSYSQGHFWNRSHALNIGVKKSTADYVVIVDIDIIYPSDFLSQVISSINRSQNKYFHYRTIYLDENDQVENLADLDLSKRPVSTDDAKGLAIYPRQDLIDVGGFNEAFCIWGGEDIELSKRFGRYKTRENQWLESTITYHQWHLNSHKTLPNGWFDYYMSFKEPPIFSGVNFKKSNRAILNIVEGNDIDSLPRFEFEYPYEMSFSKFSNTLWNLSRDSAIRIKIEDKNKTSFKTKGKIVAFFNSLLTKLSAGYNLTDLDIATGKRVPFESIFSFLFFSIIQVDKRHFDYYIIEFEVNKIFDVCVYKK
ncbi:MAG: glycosyltransferase [Cyclobacteriaceae bacterium]